MNTGTPFVSYTVQPTQPPIFQIVSNVYIGTAHERRTLVCFVEKGAFQKDVESLCTVFLNFNFGAWV